MNIKKLWAKFWSLSIQIGPTKWTPIEPGEYEELTGHVNCRSRRLPIEDIARIVKYKFVINNERYRPGIPGVEPPQVVDILTGEVIGQVSVRLPCPMCWGTQFDDNNTCKMCGYSMEGLC